MVKMMRAEEKKSNEEKKSRKGISKYNFMKKLVKTTI